MNLEMRIRQTQEIRLTQEQRILIQTQTFSLRLELIQALRGEKYEPSATCPFCSRQLTPIEIIRGFNQNPNDFTTCCSGCGHRFEPRLICFFDGSRIELPFFCNCQALDQLQGKKDLAPERFARDFPGLYRSLIVHHGGLRQAFAKIDVEYNFEEISDWRHKIQLFLGRLPDTTIAELVHVSANTIRHMRKKQGIERYRVSRALKEIEETED